MHTCIYTYARTITFIHSSIHREREERYIHTCTYIHVHTYMYTYIHTYIYIYTHTHIYMHTCIYTYVRTITHSYKHSYIHTFTHTYIHTHTHTSIHTEPGLPTGSSTLGVDRVVSGHHVYHRFIEHPFYGCLGGRMVSVAD